MLPAEVDHLQDLANFDATFTAQTLSGGATAYDGTYWHARNPVNVLQKIAANGIPAYLVGGEYDLFQRGEPLDFSGLQNAWAGRPVTAPMSANQRVTGRYQLLDGPFTHLSGSTAALNPLMLEWFDTWLKGRHTGMATTPTPLHYYDLGTNKYTEHARYPFRERAPDPAVVRREQHADVGHVRLRARRRCYWSPVGNPCGRPTDQWSAGAPSLATGYVQRRHAVRRRRRLERPARPVPHDVHDHAAREARRRSPGPIDVTVNATATTKDTEWVAEVEDVAPDGTSTPLTEGALLGSLRHVATNGTWRAGGQILLPNHTYAQARCPRRSCRAADPLRPRGVPDLREHRGRPPHPGDAVDRGHAAPRPDRPDAGEPDRRRLPGAARLVGRRDPAHPLTVVSGMLAA